MNDGMLWIDDTKGMLLKDKIERAVSYYQEKYGKRPNLVVVRPDEFEDVQLPGITIEQQATIQKNHLMVGVK
jgi:hypothetical protein